MDRLFVFYFLTIIFIVVIADSLPLSNSGSTSYNDCIIFDGIVSYKGSDLKDVNRFGNAIKFNIYGIPHEIYNYTMTCKES